MALPVYSNDPDSPASKAMYAIALGLLALFLIIAVSRVCYVKRSKRKMQKSKRPINRNPRPVPLHLISSEPLPQRICHLQPLSLPVPRDLIEIQGPFKVAARSGRKKRRKCTLVLVSVLNDATAKARDVIRVMRKLELK